MAQLNKIRVLSFLDFDVYKIKEIEQIISSSLLSFMDNVFSRTKQRLTDEIHLLSPAQHTFLWNHNRANVKKNEGRKKKGHDLTITKTE